MNDALPVAYVDGRYLPPGEARVPALDRGFLYGDGVYELIPVYAGRPLALEAHLARLERSLGSIRCPDPYDRGAWTSLVERLVEANGGGQMSIYIQVTRGATSGRDHRFPATPRPTVFAMCTPMQGPARESLEQGVAAVTLPDQRWGRCDIKSVSLMANVLARQAADEAGGGEAILLRDGRLTEGASSSIMIVTGGIIASPPDGPGILPSVTRDLLLGLAHDARLPWTRREVLETELRSAEEILVASSAREVLAVTRLDGAAVGGGHPGPVWHQLYELFQQLKARLVEAAA